ncbi:MAG: Gfo/Idh/MocA family protein [Qingshengfaniella sp.]
MTASLPPVRYAVVGAGWIAQEAFLPAMHQVPNARTAALVSGSPDTAETLARFHDIPRIVSYTDYDQLLAGDTIDAVYIALPNSLHADFAIRAAQAGKHVLVEKPLAIDATQCQAMIAAAEQTGVHLMTAYRLHHEPGTLDLLARIAAGEIGIPRLCTAVFSFLLGDGNHRLSARHWGGPLQDVGVYCLNAMRHVFGAEPQDVSAVVSDGGGNPRYRDVPESIAVTLRFPGGALGQFIASFGASDQDFYMVTGTKGSLRLDPGFRFETATVLEQRTGLTRQRHPQPHSDHFGAMIRYFSDCIQNQTAPRLTGAEGLADVSIMRAIEQAALSGRAQPITGLPTPVQPGPDMLRLCPLAERKLVL